MRKLATLAATLGLLGSLLVPAVASAGHPCEDALAGVPNPPAGKVTLCHFTGSESNPTVINTVSQSAQESHADHHGDCWKFPNGTIQCAP